MNTTITATLALALLAGPALQAHGPKHRSAHDVAVEKCTAAYEAASAAAHAPNSATGAARLHAMHAAAEAKKRCVAKAPK